MNPLIFRATALRIAVATLLFAHTTAFALDLVKDGQPLATIVTTVPAEAFAAAPPKPVKGAKRAAPLVGADAEEAAAEGRRQGRCAGCAEARESRAARLAR